MQTVKHFGISLLCLARYGAQYKEHYSDDDDSCYIFVIYQQKQRQEKNLRPDLQ